MKAASFHKAPNLKERGMYSFPVAAIRKYYKLGGLKQKKCVLSQSWSLEV